MISGPRTPARAPDARDAVSAAPSGPSAALLWALGISLTVLLAAVIAWVLATGPNPPAWDQTLHRDGLQLRTTGRTDFAIAVSVTSEYVAYVVAALGTALALRPRAWWFGAVAGMLTLAFEQGVRVALAFVAARGRPPETDWAFHAAGYSLPSGHTATATFAAGLLCLGLFRWSRSGWRFVVLAVLVVWVFVDGVSRVYLGLHWATDVVAGWLLGALFIVLAAALFARVRASRSLRLGLPDADRSDGAGSRRPEE
jgi:membrane-associated phospholipid phosphatase